MSRCRLRNAGNAGDAGDSRARRIGLADLSNGYELKTLSQASSFSTIDGYLRRASKKLNAIAVVFDNTENGALGDAELAEFVESARRRFGGRVYILEGERYGRVR